MIVIHLLGIYIPRSDRLKNYVMGTLPVALCPAVRKPRMIHDVLYVKYAF